MPLEVSVVVVSREKRVSLSKTIDCLAAQSIAPSKYEIIIVDDGSEKGDLQGLVAEKKKAFKNIRCLRQGKRSLAAGRNLGTKGAKAPIVAFTDNDCLPEKNWLAELIKPFKEKGVVGVEGKLVTDLPRRLFTNAPENLEGCKFTGANIAYRRQTIQKLGGFDERMAFWREDSEFAFRAMGLGKIVFAAKAVVYHPLRKDSPLGVFRYLFLLRNEWVCFFRHPVKYLKYFQSDFTWNLAKSAAALIIVLAILAQANIIILATLFCLEVVNYWNTTIKFSVNLLDFKETSEFLVFIFLSFTKDLFFPIFLVIGLLDALLFMVAK